MYVELGKKQPYKRVGQRMLLGSQVGGARSGLSLDVHRLDKAECRGMDRVDKKKAART